MHRSELWPLDRYKYIDKGGIYTGSQSVHNPGKEGYRYDVIHPITKKPCKQPLMGYRFPKETMVRLIDDKRILYGEDENKIVELKVYASEYEDKLPSIIELDGRTGSYDLKDLYPESQRLFTNPKPYKFLNSFLSYVLTNEDLILDFFAGSGSLGHAVLELNRVC
jgi:adenine-specific DNA-methyltransferase